MKVTLAALAGLAAASKHRPRVGVGPLRGTSGFESRLAAADAGLATNGTRPPPAEWVIRGPPGPHQLEHAPGPPMLGTTKTGGVRDPGPLRRRKARAFAAAVVASFSNGSC